MDRVLPEQLPSVVVQSIREKFKGAVIVSAERNNERNDYVYFSVKIKQDNHTKKVEINENGEVVKTENEGG